MLIPRRGSIRPTWRLGLVLPALIVLALWSTSTWWLLLIGRSLVCSQNRATSDAILVENFDPDYLLFERAAQLRRARCALRVLVPVHVDPGRQEPNDVALAVTEVMARIARTGPVEIIPIRESEPIALNAARDVQRFLDRERIRSLIVVTPVFRSRRSALVYRATLGRAGIAVRCEPVEGSRGPETWTKTWHGVQNVVEQWIKLQYYRLYVLPFLT